MTSPRSAKGNKESTADRNEERMAIDDVMTLLNKESGLMGVSADSLDTRVLMKEYDSNRGQGKTGDGYVCLSRKEGGWLLYLGDRIGRCNHLRRRYRREWRFSAEDCMRGSAWFRARTRQPGKRQLIDAEGLLSSPESRLRAWVIPTQEGLQMAHECVQAATENAAPGQH